jgi:hypothetical protein
MCLSLSDMSSWQGKTPLESEVFRGPKLAHATPATFHGPSWYMFSPVGEDGDYKVIGKQA